MKLYLLALGGALLLGSASRYIVTAKSASLQEARAAEQAGAALDTGAAKAQENDAEIARLLAAALKESLIPGAIAAIASADGEFRVGAAGVRKANSDIPVEPTDLMHIGSCTKAMTGALIARLVDRGKLKWTTTIAEGLPELSKRIHGDYGAVTLLDLLRHTSGMPANAPNWFGFSKLGLHERRFAIAAASLGDAASHDPGASYRYSNLGVMVAGLMAETAMDSTWEELVAAEVFGPLGMTTASFGAPGVKGEVTQPWGHKLIGGKALLPMQADNAAALGPAGTVHLSLRDWARFALEFTDEVGASSDFLKPASRAKLIEVGLDDYACGWIVTNRPWARSKDHEGSRGLALTHSGSNTMWFATVWVAPETGRVYLAAVNAAGGAVGREVDQMVSGLIRSSGAKVPRPAGK